MTAAAIVISAGVLGLLGTIATALLTRKSGSETLGLDTLRLALETQGRQIDSAEHRIDDLEEEVRTCHQERDADRRTYRDELAQLRAQIGQRP